MGIFEKGVYSKINFMLQRQNLFKILFKIVGNKPLIVNVFGSPPPPHFPKVSMLRFEASWPSITLNLGLRGGKVDIVTFLIYCHCIFIRIYRDSRFRTSKKGKQRILQNSYGASKQRERKRNTYAKVADIMFVA